MSNLNNSDNERVNASYNAGAEKMTEDDLNDVLGKEKKFYEKGQKLGGTWEKARLLFEMLKDYKAGRYTDVPWKVIAAIVFAIVYFFWPFDVIPDILIGLGYADDIAVFTIVLSQFNSQIEAYKAWRNKQLRQNNAKNVIDV